MSGSVLLWVIGGLATVVVLYIAIFKSRWREELGDTADLDPNYRQGPVLHLGGDDFDEPWRRAERSLQNYPPRETVHPHPRPTSKRAIQHIVLTRKHLEHVNIIRRMENRPPLNNYGFRAAVARQAITSAPIHSQLDWVDYLILYESMSSAHHQALTPVSDPIVIAPGEPFNGQGGQYAGAGATSSFDTPVSDPAADRDELGRAATRGLLYGSAGAFAAGAALAGADPGPLHDGSLPPPGGARYPGNDPQWADDAAALAPGYQGVDPNPPEQAEPETETQPDPPDPPDAPTE